MAPTQRHNSHRGGTGMSLSAYAFANSQAHMARYRAVLGRVSVFEQLSPEAVATLAARAEVHAATPGAVLVTEDQAQAAFYVLAEGRAKVALFGGNGRELTLRLVRAGDFFGEMGLFAP